MLDSPNAFGATMTILLTDFTSELPAINLTVDCLMAFTPHQASCFTD